jgi:hypothetical protein
MLSKPIRRKRAETYKKDKDITKERENEGITEQTQYLGTGATQTRSLR